MWFHIRLHSIDSSHLGLFRSGIHKVEEEAPLIIDHTSTKMVSMGHTANFSCRARGQPEPTVQWLHKGRPLKRNRTDDHTEVWVDRGDLLVRSERSGVHTFHCLANNSTGTAQSTAKLVVYGKAWSPHVWLWINSEHCSYTTLYISKQYFTYFCCNVELDWKGNRPFQFKYRSGQVFQGKDLV